MNYLPPIVLAEGEAKRQDYAWSVDGEPFDFTGYTGTWRIVQSGETVANGTTALSSGLMTLNITADQIAELVDEGKFRQRVVGQMQIDLVPTMTFQAAVKLWGTM
jgi:hypothetical protein